MIACEQVAYAVSNKGETRYLVHPLTFDAHAGKVTLVRGDSGAGKSTLLSMIAGVLRPTEGQVRFRNEPISRFSAAHRDKFRQRVGLVSQRLHLFNELTSLENVLLPGVPREQDGLIEKAKDLLAALDVPLQQAVVSLSGGEQQRVAIARALLMDPDLLVLDEPSAHQDVERLDTIVALIHAALEREATVVVAAHDPRVEDRLNAQTVLTLAHGKL